MPALMPWATIPTLWFFFDDDFLPSRYWLENLRLLFASRADIVGVTGAVLADGIKAAGLTWDEAARLVEDADQGPEKTARFIKNDYSPYGCNMAFRRSAIGELRFDERLVLYGWQEDTDFGARIAKHGCCVFSNALWGVHLGSKNGRGPTDETVRAIRNAPPVQRATPGRRDTARRIPLPRQNP
jgi:GT2 family glycosyltransferase